MAPVIAGMPSVGRQLAQSSSELHPPRRYRRGEVLRQGDGAVDVDAAHRAVAIEGSV